MTFTVTLSGTPSLRTYRTLASYKLERTLTFKCLVPLSQLTLHFPCNLANSTLQVSEMAGCRDWLCLTEVSVIVDLLFPYPIPSAEVYTYHNPETLTCAWREDNTTSLQYSEHVSTIASFGPKTALYFSCKLSIALTNRAGPLAHQ